MVEQPVLVIHGVANRNQTTFEQEVKLLQQAVGDSFQLVPVWWADLGAKTEFLDDTLPDMHAQVVRSELSEPDLSALAASIGTENKAYQVRGDVAREEIIIRAAQLQLGDKAVRADDTLESAIRQAWSASNYLPLVRDQRALEAIGRAVAVASGAGESPRELPNQYVTRGSEDQDLETRGIGENIGNAAKAVIGEIDKVVGFAIGQLVGDLNQTLRSALAEPIALFLGDILAYQRKQEEIQNRVIETIKQSFAGWGTQEKPIAVAAHSLGGVIAFDAATRALNPLWISDFITFGSQSSFFEVLDPRPNLIPYTPGQPIQLPPTIGQWTSLWEPLDVLAFAVGKVFKLSSGASPVDVRTIHDLKSGWSTHGSYWTCSELVEAIRKIAS